MQNIIPSKFGITYTEMNNFSSTFAANCTTDYFGWRLHKGFVLNNFSPSHYFETYHQLGLLVRFKYRPLFPTPKRII